MMLLTLDMQLEGKQRSKQKSPATVNVASCRSSPGSAEVTERSKANAEMARSRFFFLSNRLIDRKFNLYKRWLSSLATSEYDS